VSALLGMMGSAMIPERASSTERIVYDPLLGSLPGLAKELSDIGRLGSTPSMTGMAFNLLGASFGDCGLIRPFASGDRIDGVGIRYRIAF
jgi:hypothetical protein